MVLVNYSGKEINAKVVYYGPGLCGKTTNLEHIYGRVPQTNRGKMVSMKTRTERTLFFDFLPIDLGDLAGFQTRFLLYTVPGQVYYNATRKLVLKGVDAVVFVADSSRGKIDENIESLHNLRENLAEHGLNLEEIPWVLQLNKRDLPDACPVEELRQALDPEGRVPAFEAVATTGEGVFETFKGVARLLLEQLTRSMGLTKPSGVRRPGEGQATGPLAGGGGPAAPFGGTPSPSTTFPRPAGLTPAPARPAAQPDRWDEAGIQHAAEANRPVAVNRRAGSQAPAGPGSQPHLTLIPGSPDVESVEEAPRILRVPVRVRAEDIERGIVIELHIETEMPSLESSTRYSG